MFVKEASCGPEIATSLHGIKQLAHPSALKTPSPKLRVKPLTYMSKTNLLSSLKGVLLATSLSIMQHAVKKVVTMQHAVKTLRASYRCDSCQAFPIVGRPWHCNQCAEFDLCARCHQAWGSGDSEVHDTTHTFRRIEEEEDVVEGRLVEHIKASAVALVQKLVALLVMAPFFGMAAIAFVCPIGRDVSSRTKKWYIPHFWYIYHS